MGQLWVISSLVLSILFLSLTVKCQEFCLGEELNMTPEELGQLMACLGPHNVTTVLDVPKEKFSCFGVCVYTIKKFMSPEGKMNKDVMLGYMERVIKPNEVKEAMKAITSKCIDDHGEKYQGKSDSTCESFVPLSFCIHEGYLRVCGHSLLK